MNRRIIITVLGTATFAPSPSAAQAHVTLQPKEAPAGGYTRLDVRVPNEEDAARTTKVVVRMPPGFAGLSYEPTPGWRGAVATRRLAAPVKTDDGTLTEEVAKRHVHRDGQGHRAGAVPGLRSVAAPARPARGHEAHVQVAADLQRWRGRALDRCARQRPPRTAGDGAGGR